MVISLLKVLQWAFHTFQNGIYVPDKDSYFGSYCAQSSLVLNYTQYFQDVMLVVFYSYFLSAIVSIELSSNILIF